MTRDKSKFITLNYYDGNSVRFSNDAPYLIKGKGSTKLIEKILCDNAYYVEGLNYNLLSVSKLNSLVCKVDFENQIAKIDDIDGKLTRKGYQTRGNLLYLDMEDATCLDVEFDDFWL